MEGLGIAIIALGPIVAVFYLLLKTVRRQQPDDTELPIHRPMAPPTSGGGDFSGDRFPRRPLSPVLSGGAALPLPDDEEWFEAAEPRHQLPPADTKWSERRAG